MKIIDGICIVSKTADEGLCVKDLLDSMNGNNVGEAVICCDNRHSAVLNAQGNEYIKDLIEEYPDKFHGFATANPWNQQVAVAEIEKRLKQGFRGVFLNPVVQGFMINDEMVYPIIEKCEQYECPIYFHTGTPMQALPFQVLSLAKRYPNVNFIIGHMGANDYIGDALASVDQAKNIYLDISLNLTVTIRNAAKIYGDRLIFGSSMPRSHISFELKKLKQAVSDRVIMEKILSMNIQSILGGKK